MRVRGAASSRAVRSYNTPPDVAVMDHVIRGAPSAVRAAVNEQSVARHGQAHSWLRDVVESNIGDLGLRAEDERV